MLLKEWGDLCIYKFAWIDQGAHERRADYKFESQVATTSKLMALARISEEVHGVL